MTARIVLIGIFIGCNHPEDSTTSDSKVMAQTMVFMFSVTLTLTFDICSMLSLTHVASCTGISVKSFKRIRIVGMGDMLRLKF